MLQLFRFSALPPLAFVKCKINFHHNSSCLASARQTLQRQIIMRHPERQSWQTLIWYKLFCSAFRLFHAQKSTYHKPAPVVCLSSNSLTRPPPSSFVPRRHSWASNLGDEEVLGEVDSWRAEWMGNAGEFWWWTQRVWVECWTGSWRSAWLRLGFNGGTLSSEPVLTAMMTVFVWSLGGLEIDLREIQLSISDWELLS